RADGREAQAARHLGRAVPPRVDPHHVGDEADRELPHALPHRRPARGARGREHGSRMIVTAIGRAVEREDLSEDLANASMEQILAGEAPAAQIAALAISLRMRGETPEEIAGMARAMRQRVPPLRTRRAPLMDTCGTGGSEPQGGVKFNIS